MKRISIAIVSALMLAAPTAQAADMAVKAPPPPPAPVATWTGWYVGLNAGYGWQNRDMDNSFAPGPCIGIVPVACTAMVTAGSTFLNTFDTRARGFIGGGQIGYNVQTNNTVWGIEADIQGANIHGSGSAAGAAPIAGFAPIVASMTGTGSEKIDWLGTLRGRLGWTPTAPLLVYATGGLAYGRTETSASFSGSFTNNPTPVFGSTILSQSTTRAGFAVGGGFEWMFAPRWSAKAEYLYYDLGKVALNQTLIAAPVVIIASDATNVQSVAHYNGSIARAGINYHF